MNLAEFIKTHADEINLNKFDEIYDEIEQTIDIRETEMTALLLDAGIDPLQYMSSVPAGFAAQLSTLEKIVIPGNIERIGYLSFSYCPNLKEAVLQNGVKIIEKSAFVGDEALENVVLPNSLTTIESTAFRGCSSLKSINIPNSVEKINSYAFRNCKLLEEITIPSK